MASLRVKLEGKKIAEKVMDFIDTKSFGPIYEEIEKSEDYHVYIREIMRCIPTYRIIDNLDIAKRMTNKEKLKLVSELFKIPYLASPEEYGEAIAKAAREQYYR